MFKYFVVIFILVAGSAIANDHSNIENQRTIEVSGVGSVISVPDRFSFSLSIEQKGRVAAKLNKEIVEKTNTIIKALTKIGVEEKALQSLQVQFNPWVEYNGKDREQKGFILTRQVKVTVTSLALYEQAIDAVLNLDINTISQFDFTDSQAEKNYQAALKHALLDAKNKANDMAEVLGLKLAGVISISEQSAGQASPVAFRTRQFQVSDSYQPGEMSTQASVKVIFALKDDS